MLPLRISATLVAGLALATSPATAQDIVVPAGTTVEVLSVGLFQVDSLTIEPGAVVRVVGPAPLRLQAKAFVAIDGTLDLSGSDAPALDPADGADVPVAGAGANLGGGAGGAGSPSTAGASAIGESGSTGILPSRRGGRGGESVFTSSASQPTAAAGGGGGSFAQALPQDGLFASAGLPGSFSGVGAVTGQTPAAGGVPGGSYFSGPVQDDFFGVGVDPESGVTIVGELEFPRGGQGGGGGGDAIVADVFPPLPWSPAADLRGGGGGGGGGLGLIRTPLLTIGPAGSIRADGGDGGVGELSASSARRGGSGGGGSGGMLILQAASFDLSTAGDDALSARGGLGGPGLATSAGGGDGGPGLIQLHPEGDAQQAILLPAGRTLDQLSIPDAKVLEPFVLD